MALHINDAGTWKQAGGLVNDGGTWKNLKGGFIKDNGFWKAFTLDFPRKAVVSDDTYTLRLGEFPAGNNWTELNSYVPTENMVTAMAAHPSGGFIVAYSNLYLYKLSSTLGFEGIVDLQNHGCSNNIIRIAIAPDGNIAVWMGNRLKRIDYDTFTVQDDNYYSNSSGNQLVWYFPDGYFHAYDGYNNEMVKMPTDNLWGETRYGTGNISFSDSRDDFVFGPDGKIYLDTGAALEERDPADMTVLQTIDLKALLADLTDRSESDQTIYWADDFYSRPGILNSNIYMVYHGTYFGFVSGTEYYMSALDLSTLNFVASDTVYNDNHLKKPIILPDMELMTFMPNESFNYFCEGFYEDCNSSLGTTSDPRGSIDIAIPAVYPPFYLKAFYQ